MAINLKEIEAKWQSYWKENAIYDMFDPSDDKRPIYAIDTPPRYTSGPMHMGHAHHYTQIDFMARYKRMKGYNVNFAGGWDCNGMPVEVKVEKERHIKMRDVPREQFIQWCNDFVEDAIQKMTAQYYMLGNSARWWAPYRTCSPEYRRVTQYSFLKMLEEGRIYRGEYPVNWCPRCRTAIADAEVEYEDRGTKLNFIKFHDEDGKVVEIATSRPEFLPACVAVAIHPDNPKTSHLKGKTLTVPLFNFPVKVIEDKEVDPEFGSGIVMICTFGDKEDIEWYYRHKLELKKLIDEDGNLTDIAGKYKGMSLMAARDAMLTDLTSQDLVIRQEPLQQRAGLCWRCSTPIEFLVTKQWFFKMLDLKDQMYKWVDEIEWHPTFMKHRILDWISGLNRDWPISRQRIFATPIPIWMCKNCGHVVPANYDQLYVDPQKDKCPMDKCPECGGELEPSKEVLDTWMDSSMSPLFITGWPDNKDLFEKAYPIGLRPQAHDIIRTWAYYSILRDSLLTGVPPFQQIMIGGHVLDSKGKPMHASKGNIVDPKNTIDTYTADAFRFWASLTTLGTDIPFSEKDVATGKSFQMKLINASRFVGMQLADYAPIDEPEELTQFDKWILSRLNTVVKESTEAFDEFKFNIAIEKIKTFFWHDFCDTYLEYVKPRVYNSELYGEESKRAAQYILHNVMFDVTKLLAPIMPHTTEEIYQALFKNYEKKASIHHCLWPEFDGEKISKYYEDVGAFAEKIISVVRKFKTDSKLSLKTKLARVVVYSKTEGIVKQVQEISDDLRTLLKIRAIDVFESAPGEVHKNNSIELDENTWIYVEL